MNIRSSIRHQPKVQRALSEGTVEQPSIIFRTPSGYQDLLLNKKAHSDPQLRELLLPIKDLAATAISSLAPKYADMIDGVSVLIDLTVEISDVVQESRVSSLQPRDATTQVANVFKDNPSHAVEHQQNHRTAIFGEDGPPPGTISVVAKVQDESVIESIESIQTVLDQAPVLGNLFQLGVGILRMIDTDPPSNRFANSSFNPERMEQLRKRLESPPGEQQGS